jgi:hypothetical protein
MLKLIKKKKKEALLWTVTDSCEHDKDPSVSVNGEDFLGSDTVRHSQLMTASEVLWSEFLATDPEVLVGFPALPDLLRNSVSGTGST